MPDSLGDLIAKRAKSNEPHEFIVIKEYVLQRFKVTPKLSISNKSIIIGVPNAGVAGSLRLSLYELQEACQTERRLVIRIG